MRDLAVRHGLVCYDPQARQVVQPQPAPMAVGLTLSSCDGSTWTDPDLAGITAALGAITSENWYVLLQRADQRWVQVGYGAHAGAGPDGYALERCEGTIEEIYRATLSAADDAVPAFHAFAQGDSSWIAGFAWTKVDL